MSKWGNCDRDEIIRQAEYFHSQNLRHMEMLERVVAERDRYREAIERHRDKIRCDPYNRYATGHHADRELWSAMTGRTPMSDDPKIAGMGMLDLVEEVHRVREQRDEALAEVERLTEERDETHVENVELREDNAALQDRLEWLLLENKRLQEERGTALDEAGWENRVAHLADGVADITAERDELLALRDTLITDLTDERVRYREALERYGRHREGCGRMLLRSSTIPPAPCSCGYQAALDGDDHE